MIAFVMSCSESLLTFSRRVPRSTTSGGDPVTSYSRARAGVYHRVHVLDLDAGGRAW